MSLKVTTLIENTQGEHLGLKTEHGISFYIEKDGKCILFDCGQSDAYIYNASQLNIDLEKLDYVVLSHGHYDHSGGFLFLTELTSTFELIMGQGFFDEKYGYRNNSYEYLGNNFREDDLKNKNINYHFTTHTSTEIADGVYIVTKFSRNNDDEIVNPRFRILQNKKFIPDPFNDEVLIAIDTPKGMVVILGCSHPGVRNMLNTVSDLFNKRIYAVLGGTHLVEAHGSSFENSISYLGNDDIKILGVSHCTGSEGMQRLDKQSSKFFHNSTGSMIYLDF
jgi:7,8-dihydropterin-6-yl-methyl-4-(beta-D-ribofuranosyl)aminobenzene 5'-phosphate synthase